VWIRVENRAIEADMKLSLTVLLLLSVGAASGSTKSPQELRATRCDVTLPSRLRAAPQFNYGNAMLSVQLSDDGTVVFRPGGPGFVTTDGALGMKFPWMRTVSGKVRVTGHRLDGSAGPLRFEAKDEYGEIGVQPTYLIFPIPGCWEVEGQLSDRADSRVTFVTKVVKIGEGPAARR
jgi:hypothetical protein